MASKPVLCDFARRLLGKSQESFLIRPGLISNERLQALAVRIASAHPDRLSPIGVLVPQNSEGYLLYLAAIASGRPVVPLSFSADPSLLKSRLESVSSELILCLEEDRALAKSFASGVLSPDESTADSFDSLPECLPDDPVFFCFTSGTSGAPRPFIRTQHAMALLGDVRGVLFEHSSDTRMISCASMLFVGFVNNLAAQIVVGFRIHFDDLSSGTEQILESIVLNKINFVSLVPTVIKSMVNSSAKDKLRKMEQDLIVNVSGEPYTRQDIRQWTEVFYGKIRFANTYGSTESGTVLGAILGPEDLLGDAPVETGMPVGGVEVLLLDDDGVVIQNPEAEGMVHVRSEMFSKCLDVVEKMTISIEGHGSNWFAMGDMARRSEVGRYSVLGRFDGVLKFHGVRLDAPSIESSLRRLGGIADVAIFAFENGGSPVPAALIIGDQALLPEVISELTTLSPLAAKFQFAFVDRIPVLANGKRDRSALHSRFLEHRLTGDDEAHRPVCSSVRTLSLLADLWSELLQSDRPRPEDCFVSLGGHSLDLISIVVFLRERYGLDCDLAVIHESMTLSEMASTIKPLVEEPRRIINLVARPEATEAILLFPGIGGHPWAFQPLMSALQTERDIFAVDWNHNSSLPAILQDLPSHLAGRPVCVVGFSLGVRVAMKHLKSLSDLDVRVSGFLGIDGRCSASLLTRAKYLVRSMREKRYARRLQGVDRYLALRSSAGWRFSAATGSFKIDVPCGVVSTKIEERSMIENEWRKQCRADVKFRFLECDHLKIVQSPIPRSAVEAIRSFNMI